MVRAASQLGQARGIRAHLVKVGIAAQEDRVLRRPGCIPRRKGGLRRALRVRHDHAVRVRIHQQMAARRPTGERGVGLTELRAFVAGQVEHEQIAVVGVDGMCAVGRDGDPRRCTDRGKLAELLRRAVNGLGAYSVNRRPQHLVLGPTDQAWRLPGRDLLGLS